MSNDERFEREREEFLMGNVEQFEAINALFSAARRPRLGTGGTVEIKHLLVDIDDETEDPDVVVNGSMRKVAGALRASGLFADFERLSEFDDIAGVDAANDLLDAMYDFADVRRILIR